MATIKYLGNNVAVDLSNARMVCRWDLSDNSSGDGIVQLWCTNQGEVVWLETNGDPVVAQDDVVSLLVQCGLSEHAAMRVSEGDIKAALDIIYSVYPAQGTSEASRLRDRRFDSLSAAMVEAEIAARDTQQPVIVEEHVRGGDTLESYTVQP